MKATAHSSTGESSTHHYHGRNGIDASDEGSMDG